MAYRTEQRDGHQTFHEGGPPWVIKYRNQLGLIPAGDAFSELELEVPGIEYILPGDNQTLRRWQDKQKSITLNTVIVSPNEGGELPLRALGYIAEAINLRVSLNQQGFLVDTLRIINPCHLGACCNDGDLEYQLAYGQRFSQQLALWMNEVWPDDPSQISLDQGQSLPLDFEGRVDFLDHLSTETQESLLARSGRYPDPETTGLYTYAHGPAWGYSDDPDLFLPLDGSRGVINFMPKSELLFLVALQDAGILNSGSATDGPVTLISARYTHAPYYHLIPGEPVLAFIIDPNKLHPMKGNLKPQSGHPRVAEVLKTINRLQYILEQQNRARKSSELQT